MFIGDGDRGELKLTSNLGGDSNTFSSTLIVMFLQPKEQANLVALGFNVVLLSNLGLALTPTADIYSINAKADHERLSDRFPCFSCPCRMELGLSSSATCWRVLAIKKG